jgi:thiol-disulfide isomerase/thioredoxin
LLVLLLIIPFPSLSNSLFQKIDIKLNNKIVLSDKKNFEKKLYDILDLRSKYVVNFWATWCIPCKKELPDLKKMKIDNKDLKVIIISIDKKSIKDQLNFLKKNKVNELTAYFDQNMTFFRSLKLRGIPTTLLIKRQKIIAKKRVSLVIIKIH